MWVLNIKRIPSHMRYLQRGVARGDPIDFASNPAQSLDHLVLAAALGEELHTDADAEKRPAFAANRLFERIDHAGHGIKATAAVGESSHSGQNNSVGARHDIRIARDQDRLTRPGVMRRSLKGFGRGMQVARAVVNDGDTHRCAPGSGKSPMTSDCPGAGAAAAGGCAGADAAGVGGDAGRRSGACRIQASKNRRSASSRSPPVTTPILRQWRRASLNRRSVLASSPARSEIRTPATTIANNEAPSARKAASSTAESKR